jgi:hypothetical protein
MILTDRKKDKRKQIRGKEKRIELKFTLEQATKAQRGRRGIDVLFL